MQIQLAVTLHLVECSVVNNNQGIRKQKMMKFKLLFTLLCFSIFDWLDYFQTVLSLGLTPISF